MASGSRHSMFHSSRSMSSNHNSSRAAVGWALGRRNSTDLGATGSLMASQQRLETMLGSLNSLLVDMQRQLSLLAKEHHRDHSAALHSGSGMFHASFARSEHASSMGTANMHSQMGTTSEDPAAEACAVPSPHISASTMPNATPHALHVAGAVATGNYSSQREKAAPSPGRALSPQAFGSSLSLPTSLSYPSASGGVPTGVEQDLVVSVPGCSAVALLAAPPPASSAASAARLAAAFASALSAADDDQPGASAVSEAPPSQVLSPSPSPPALAPQPVPASVTTSRVSSDGAGDGSRALPQDEVVVAESFSCEPPLSGGFSSSCEVRQRRRRRQQAPHGEHATQSLGVGSDGEESLNRHEGTFEMGGTATDDSCALAVQQNDGFIAPTLPVFWPETLDARPEFVVLRTLGDGFGLSEAVRRTHIIRSRSSKRAQSSHDMMHFGIKTYFQDPNANARIVMQVTGLFVLMYELTVVPYMLAWDIALTGAFRTGAVLSAGFWTLDLISSFFCGYMQDGEVITDCRRVIRQYLTTWFCLDFALVSADWLNLALLIAEGEQGAGSIKLVRFLKLAKAFRLLALLKIFRVAKVAKRMMDLLDKGLSEGSRLALSFTALLLAILWTNHILACAWFYIGKFADSDTGSRWLDGEIPVTTGALEMHYRDLHEAFQYLSCLHWAIAQTTLGSVDILPTNSAERVCNFTCQLIGLLCGSTIVSLLSATMVDHQARMRDKNKQMGLLRRFLKENEVSSSISVQVQKQVRERLGRQDKLTKDEVPALALVSTALHTQLHSQICEPHLLRHPVLRWMHNVDAMWFSQFCAAAVEVIHFVDGDEVFIGGQVSSAAYHVMSGAHTYSQEPETSAVDELVNNDVPQGAWLAEPTLWCRWIHVGTLRARSNSEVVRIIPEELLTLTSGHRAIARAVCLYGRAYLELLQDCKPPVSAFPSDLFVPFTECADVVRMLPSEARKAYCAITLETACVGVPAHSFRNSYPRFMVNQLCEEASRGTSVSVYRPSGEVERAVHSVALQLENEQNEIFVQIAEWADHSAEACCEFPSIQMTEMETTHAAFTRLLSTRLEPIAPVVELNGTRPSIGRSPVEKSSVESRHYQRVCLAYSTSEIPVKSFSIRGLQARRRKPGFSKIRASSFSKLRTISDADVDVPDRFMDHSVYYLRDDDGEGSPGRFYAWLTEKEFDFLCSPQGEKDLVSWTDFFQRPEDIKVPLSVLASKLSVQPEESSRRGSKDCPSSSQFDSVSSNIETSGTATLVETCITPKRPSYAFDGD